jgi:hypothetical protein
VTWNPASLACRDARLVGVEAGLAQKELQADGGEVERIAGEAGAQVMRQCFMDGQASGAAICWRISTPLGAPNELVPRVGADRKGCAVARC